MTRLRPMLALALPLLWIATTGAAPDKTTVRPVNPLTVQDDDFARHRDPAEWRGLKVTRLSFKEERADWRMWRIVNVRHPKGPLWFVPHDNENAGFEAGLASLRKYGGVLIAVDAGISPGNDGIRMNRAIDYGRPVDPNRNFDSALPGYARRVLADLARGAGPIIALHTNAPGFDPTDSRCNRDAPKGDGIISILFCDDTLIPSASQRREWPFDDDDSVAFATFLSKQSPSDAFCRDAMVGADFNVVQERVLTSDGSLSNYAVLHGLAYLNFETQDRGLEPAALAGARDRLTYIVDRALGMCAPQVKPLR